MTKCSYEYHSVNMEMTERQAGISELLRQEAFLTIDALAENFGVTTQTIRRDVNALCDLGLARRRHGGIAPLTTEGNLAYASRQILNRSGKMHLAEEVARHIPNNSTLSIGIGTTPEVVAGALLNHKGLRIFTNSLSIAQICSVNTDFEINIAGGRLRHEDHDVLGNSVERFFEAYKTDYGIFGVAGVELSGGLLDFYEEEVRVRDQILRNCRESFLVLDYQKFGRSAHVRGGNITDASKVFCDKFPPGEISAKLKESETELIVSKQEIAA